MHGFSTVDGFVEITESLAEMIKYMANEPSVGLFYIQQHTQNAVPNLINLKNNVGQKSNETSLQTEDLEDSISMVRSMKDCGFTIADDMIKDMRKSLVLMSTKEAKRGLINKRSFSFQMGRSSSWGWDRSSVYDPNDERNSSYISSVFKSARQKASNLKWPQLDSSDNTMLGQGEKQLLSYPTPPLSTSTSSSRPDAEADELPLSSQVADDEPHEEATADVSLSHHKLLSLSENYDDFKADKEAKLQEWLGRSEENK